MTFCVDCNSEVEVNPNGTCSTCGSSSVLDHESPFEKEEITADKLLREARALAAILDEVEFTRTPLRLASLGFLFASIEVELDLPKELFLKNIENIWDMAYEMKRASKIVEAHRKAMNN